MNREQVDKYFEENNQICIVWDIADVQSIRPNLNREQAMRVLNVVKHKHDANYGVSWQILEDIADYLYPIGGKDEEL